jgi:hypothetical protein
VGVAVGLEVVREVLVGVAPLVGADDPDLLAAQLLAQRLEGADLVHAADHAPAGLAGVLEDQGGPVAEHALVGGYGLAGRVVGEPGVGVPPDQVQGVENRPVGGVVRPELKHVQQLDQTAAVVVGVGRLQRGLHRPPVDRALGLELVHELAQGLLAAGHGRVDDLAYGVVGPLQRGRGDRDQKVLLARNSLERVDQFLGDLPVRAGADPVHRGDQQLDQGVGDLPQPGV